MDLELAAIHEAYVKKTFLETITWLQHHDRSEREERSRRQGATREEDEDDVAIRVLSELDFERDAEEITKCLCRYS